MISIKKTKYLSANVIRKLSPTSRAEWEGTKKLRKEFYNTLTKLWVISVDHEPVCVIGLIRRSFLGFGCEFVFLYCNAMSRYFKTCINFFRKGFRRLLRIYSLLSVRVEKEFLPGRRFVEFFGFKELYIDETNPVPYVVYELRAT